MRFMKHEKQPKPVKPNRYDPIGAALQEVRDEAVRAGFEAQGSLL